MRASVLDVVRDVIDQQAPHERQLVEDLVGLDYGLVVRRMRQAASGGRADPLGFGLDDLATVLTPLVLLLVDEACRAAVADGTGRLMTRATSALGRLRPSARRAITPPEVPDLDRGQLAAVRRRVREEAVRRGLSEADAGGLADSVVARLALAGAADGLSVPPGAPDRAGGPDGPGDGPDTDGGDGDADRREDGAVR
ncbi:hypothetical protein ABZX40_29985 [Streptomyces sp. NPDC004610]|uniref:hypothetical protein n=1 Tax=unclassified Streptomyces TaxID=2593676 RepID=UPI0033BBFC4A